MFSNELTTHILRNFPFQPTADQATAVSVFANFLFDRESQALMILRGSAGTGKTSLAGSIVKTLIECRQKVLLLAPTGRAAKVFSINSEGHPAFTIHRKIYRQRSFEANGGMFNINDNLHTDTLFIVDEASMVANSGGFDSAFGSGRLLDDLIKFVYQGRNCRLLLMGDTAQLPPIGEAESPALISQVMEGYGMQVYDCDLNEVLRQSRDSGILYNATMIRHMITHDDITALPKIRFWGFADIQMVPGNELIDCLSNSYAKVGIDETMVVTRNNKRANIYNQGIRNMILEREEQLSAGDQLMIVKNNYYWTEKEKSTIHFLANGDRAHIRRVRNIHEMHGFTFAKVWLLFPDYENEELQATLILDSLTTEAPALTAEQSEQLFQRVMEDYADLPLKAERVKQLKSDGYFNAIQVKYAYAITCHKAQGGQWEHVYIDQGYMADEMLTPDYIHWLYTAFTRAKTKLFLVNWPQVQTQAEKKEEEE